MFMETEANSRAGCGTRLQIYENAHWASHAFGSRIFNDIYRTLFDPLFINFFSGYRAFSRRFVKTFPAISSSFEIEEMSVHTSQLRMPIVDIATRYGARQGGSASKLHTFRDAFRILRTFLLLFKEIQPARLHPISLFFSLLFVVPGIR